MLLRIVATLVTIAVHFAGAGWREQDAPRVNFAGLYLLFTALAAMLFTLRDRVSCFCLLDWKPSPAPHRITPGPVNYLLPIAASPHRAYPRTHILLN